MTDANNPHKQSSGDGDGLSVLDLENLPRTQYRIMKTVMREVDCPHQRLISLLEGEIARAEIETAVVELCNQQWLIKTNDTYRANLRRKNARVLSEFQPKRRGTATLRGIWDSLESGDDKSKK